MRVEGRAVSGAALFPFLRRRMAGAAKRTRRERTGEVRPASRARNQAREPRRRRRPPAPAHGGAGDTRETGTLRGGPQFRAAKGGGDAIGAAYGRVRKTVLESMMRHCHIALVRFGHGPAGRRPPKDEAAGQGERARGRSEPGTDREALQPECRERPGPPRPGRSGTRPRRAGAGPVSRHSLPVAASSPVDRQRSRRAPSRRLPRFARGARMTEHDIS